GYYKELARRGIKHRPVSDKANNKQRLIEDANVAFLKGKIRLTPAAALLEEELVACTWDEKVDGKIVNGSKYHLFDSLQYAVYGFPEFDPSVAREWKSFNHEMRRVSQEAKQKKAKEREQHVFRIQAKQRRKQTRKQGRKRRVN
ncbi:hypothetical protein OAF54_00005, partial [bacterium]|nr:hypothetical protein [bacterium]